MALTNRCRFGIFGENWRDAPTDTSDDLALPPLVKKHHKCIKNKELTTQNDRQMCECVTTSTRSRTGCGFRHANCISQVMPKIVMPNRHLWHDGFL